MANDENYGLIEWPDGRRSNPSDARGGYTGGPFSVKPSEIPALSKSGKAWFTATARKARMGVKPGDTGQQLADLARALKAAVDDPARRDLPGPAPLTPDEIDEADEIARRRAALLVKINPWLKEGRAEEYAAKFRDEERTGALVRKGLWFAFGGDGKVVLSLRTSREAALEIAVAYNKAGGDLVLLAPSRDLREVPTEQCVAVPSDVPPAPPASKADPLDTVREAWGAYEDSKVAVHDTTLGTLVTAVWGAVVDPSRASATDADPELVEDVRDLLGRPAVWTGTWKRLPKATFKDPRDGAAVVQVLPLTDARAHRSRFSRDLLTPLLADVKGEVAVDLFEAHGAAYLSLRIRRPDGLVGLLAGRAS